MKRLPAPYTMMRLQRAANRTLTRLDHSREVTKRAQLLLHAVFERMAQWEAEQQDQETEKRP